MYSNGSIEEKPSSFWNHRYECISSLSYYKVQRFYCILILCFYSLASPQSPVLAAALQKLFNHSNCSSLHRQLNMYGWSKKKGERNKGAFVNPHFHRDLHKSALFLIKRRPPGSKRTATAQEQTSTPVQTKTLTPSKKRKRDAPARSSKTPPSEPQKAALSRKPKHTPVQKEAPISSTPVETKKSSPSIKRKSDTPSRNTKSQPAARKSDPSRTPKRKTPPVQTKNPVSSKKQKCPSSIHKRKSPLAEMEKPVPSQTQKMPCTLPAQPKNEFVEQHATPSRTQMDPAFVRSQEMSEKNALLAVIRTRESPRTISSAAG